MSRTNAFLIQMPVFVLWNRSKENNVGVLKHWLCCQIFKCIMRHFNPIQQNRKNCHSNWIFRKKFEFYNKKIEEEKNRKMPDKRPYCPELLNICMCRITKLSQVWRQNSCERPAASLGMLSEWPGWYDSVTQVIRMPVRVTVPCQTRPIVAWLVLKLFFVRSSIDLDCFTSHCGCAFSIKLGHSYQRACEIATDSSIKIRKHDVSIGSNIFHYC